VALALRKEKGWVPDRIWLDPGADVWIAKVIDWAELPHTLAGGGNPMCLAATAVAAIQRATTIE